MKKFKIGILGLSGEGKTIYMTSIYYLLQKGRHPLLKLINDNHAAAKYFNDKATLLDELEWDKACSFIAGNEDNETNLKFYLDYEGERVEVELMDYKGGNINITHRLNNGADKDLMTFINVCDAAILLISADSFNEHSQLAFNPLTSFSALLRSISVQTKPLAFVISKADKLPNTKRYNNQEAEAASLAARQLINKEKNQDLLETKNVIFESFIELLSHQNLIYKNDKRNKTFHYAISSKLCVEILKSNSYTYADKIKSSELPDILRPMVDLIQFCLDFPPSKYFKTDLILNKLESNKIDLFIEDYKKLNDRLLGFDENIEEAFVIKWEEELTTGLNRKKECCNYLNANKPEFKIISESNSFNEKLYGFKNGIINYADFERLKDQYGI